MVRRSVASSRVNVDGGAVDGARRAIVELDGVEHDLLVGVD